MKGHQRNDIELQRMAHEGNVVLEMEKFNHVESLTPQRVLEAATVP